MDRDQCVSQRPQEHLLDPRGIDKSDDTRTHQTSFFLLVRPSFSSSDQDKGIGICLDQPGAIRPNGDFCSLPCMSFHRQRVSSVDLGKVSHLDCSNCDLHARRILTKLSLPRLPSSPKGPQELLLNPWGVHKSDGTLSLLLQDSNLEKSMAEADRRHSSSLS